MKTRIFGAKQVKLAAALIAKGELVAFPTETVYGLGADALNPEAVKKIFVAKGRPSDNPLIVHVTGIEDAKKLAFVTEKAEKLMKKFWPGPLTIVLKKRQIVPKEVTAGLATVAVRMPKNRIALELIRLSKKPIAAPSANLSGKPSTTSFGHVFDDLNGKVAGIIKSADSEIGLESTVIDLASKTPLLLRPGAVTFEQLKGIFPKIKKASSNSKKPRSPGMKYRHYSPKAEVVLFEKKAREKIGRYRKKCLCLGKKTAVIEIKDLKKASKSLFKKFREFDKKGFDCILVSGVAEKGIGLALMNRLRKSASIIVK